MGSGGGDVTQTTEPPEWQKPFMQHALNAAQNQFMNYTPQYYPGSTVAGVSPYTVQGVDALAQSGQSPWTQQIQNTAAGSNFMLGQAMNPALNPLLAAGLSNAQGSSDFLGAVQNRALNQDFNLGNFQVQDPNVQQVGQQDNLQRLMQQNVNVQAPQTTGMDITNPISQSLLSQFGQGGVQNPFIGQVIENAMNLNNRNFLENVMPSLQNQSALSGGFGGTRQGVAEGIAARGLNEANARTAGDLLANQFNIGNQQALAANQAAGQLGLAGLGQDQSFNLATAGLAQNDLARQLQAQGVDLSRQFQNQQLGMQQGQFDLARQAQGLQQAGLESQFLQNAIGQGLDASRMGLGALESGQQQGFNAMLQNQALAPQIQALPQQGIQNMLAAGDIDRQYRQQLIDEAVNRFNFNQQQPIDALNRYANQVGLGGLLGGQVTGPGPQSGGFAGALGGAATGAALAGSLGLLGGGAGAGAGATAGLAATGPIGWGLIGLGALAGLL